MTQDIVRQMTHAAFLQRLHGETMERVRARWQKKRPFEHALRSNLERKLACGALTQRTSLLILQELAERAYPE